MLIEGENWEGLGRGEQLRHRRGRGRDRGLLLELLNSEKGEDFIQLVGDKLGELGKLGQPVQGRSEVLGSLWNICLNSLANSGS